MVSRFCRQSRLSRYFRYSRHQRSSDVRFLRRCHPSTARRHRKTTTETRKASTRNSYGACDADVKYFYYRRVRTLLAATAALHFVLGFGIRLRLPLHVIRRIGSTAGERLYVIDHVSLAAAARRPCRRARMLPLKAGPHFAGTFDLASFAANASNAPGARCVRVRPRMTRPGDTRQSEAGNQQNTLEYFRS